MVEIGLFARLNVHHPPSPLLPGSRFPRLRPKRQDKGNSLVALRGAYVPIFGGMFPIRFFHCTYKQTAAGSSGRSSGTERHAIPGGGQVAVTRDPGRARQDS